MFLQVLGLMLVPVIVLQSLLEKENNRSRYNPKSRRSRVTRVFKQKLDDITNRIGNSINAFLDRHETTWKEYKERKRRQAAIRAAHNIKTQHETDAERSPWQTKWTHPSRVKWKQNKSCETRQIVVHDTTIMSATNSRGEPSHDNVVRFDTDSAAIGIDNRASACISHRIEDFDGPVSKVKRNIKGFGGETTRNVFMGTIVWKWCDDEGRIHKFRIPNSYYVPDGHVRLLSPQHWAKSQKGRVRHNDGYGETTTAFKTILFWQERKHQLTVEMGKHDNVATFYLAPGHAAFDLFCQQAEINYNESVENPLYAHETQLVSDDEERKDEDDFKPLPRPRQTLWSKLTGLPKRITKVSKDSEEEDEASPITTTFNLDGPTQGPRPVVIEEEEDRQPTTAAQELLRYHQRFGHVSFAKLRNMAKQNILPRHLANCHVPACTTCMYAKAIRRQWRSKTTKNWEEAERATKPGVTISVDQLVSPTPGFVAQLTGKLTTKRYKYATVFVDQYSGFSFVYLQKTSNAEETILGKKAFEATCRTHGISVRHYHVDNGIFRASKWVEECMRNNQALTFAGVNAHHSNGLAERRIRSLQELARAMLLHANKRWPNAVTTNLWPYAVRMACDAINEVPNLRDESNRLPLQTFTGSTSHTNVKHWKPFGCPVYVLEAPLQSGRGIFHKWKQRSKVGIYLGRSPQHGRNVALVLDRNTGLVSPQFHVTFDPGFYTVKQDKFDTLWQIKAGFVLKPKQDQTKNIPSESDRSIKRKSSEKGMPKPEGAGKRRRTSQNRDESSNETHAKDRLLEQTDRAEPGPENDDSRPRTESEQGVTAKQMHRTAEGSSPVSQQEISNKQTQNDQQHSDPARNIIQAMMAEVKQATVGDVEGELLCYTAMFPAYAGETETDPLLAYKATTDPDTMYLHEAMREPDADEFKKAMQKEWDDQLINGNFSIMKRSEVPEGATVLPAVWQMRRKRDIRTRQVKKYKARLNIDGSRMRHGQHYDQTYAPVATWNSIRTLMIMSALHNWHTRQIDYVLAFPQAPVERTIYMKIPRGFKIQDGDTKDYILQLHRNVYGQHQAG